MVSTHAHETDTPGGAQKTPHNNGYIEKHGGCECARGVAGQVQHREQCYSSASYAERTHLNRHPEPAVHGGAVHSTERAIPEPRAQH